MTTYRVLASQSQGEVQLRCTHHIPPPLYALILGTLEHEDLEEFGAIVVFSIALHEQHTSHGTEGSFEVGLEAGTPEEWASLPILPSVEMRWETNHEA